MTPQDRAQLFRELADELYSFVRNKPMDSPTNNRQIDMVQRARHAAEEIEGREVTPKQLKELANLIGSAECADIHHDCLGIALATYFESSPHRPDNDPPCDEDGLDGWTQWVMVKTNEMLLEAANLATRARQAAAEIEGRKQTGPDLDDLIDQSWRLHETTGCQGERFMYDYNFDRAVRWVLARFGGGEGES